jgi:hypothetical protein
MHITKNLWSAAQSSGRVKIFCSEQQQVRAGVKRKLENMLAKKLTCKTSQIPCQPVIARHVNTIKNSDWLSVKS